MILLRDGLQYRRRLLRLTNVQVLERFDEHGSEAAVMLVSCAPVCARMGLVMVLPCFKWATAPNFAFAKPWN